MGEPTRRRLVALPRPAQLIQNPNLSHYILAQRVSADKIGPLRAGPMSTTLYYSSDKESLRT